MWQKLFRTKADPELCPTVKERRSPVCKVYGKVVSVKGWNTSKDHHPDKYSKA